jgi:hypothetical protein
VHDSTVVLIFTCESQDVLARVPAEPLFLVVSRVGEDSASNGGGVLIVEIIDLYLILLVQVIFLQARNKGAIEVQGECHDLGIIVSQSLYQQEVLKVPEADQRILTTSCDVSVSIIYSE